MAKQFTEITNAQGNIESVRLRVTPDSYEMSDRDRCADHSYAVAFAMDYEVFVPRQPVEKGRGSMIGLSSSGLRLRAERPLATGLAITLSILWPLALHDGVQMQLVVWGKVVRTRGVEAEVRIVRYELNTRGHGSKLLDPLWRGA